MIREVILSIRILAHLRGYEPQSVTLKSLRRWLRQFPREHRLPLLRLLEQVHFISKAEVIETLYRLNEEILTRLRSDGISIANIIYVALDSAGSSSGVILNLLRDRANLERRGAQFVHSRDVTTLAQVTRKLERGALIYVDDFAGTGKQFARNRTHAFQFVIGSFSEFFLLPCICEEASDRLEQLGVVPVTGRVHTKAERPLHPTSDIFVNETKEGLLSLCKQIHQQKGLGFDKLATSVVLYRNAPNSTPLVLRGNLKQKPHCGILPRYDDLPF